MVAALIGGRWWTDSPVEWAVTHWTDDDHSVVSSYADHHSFPLHVGLDPDGGLILSWAAEYRPCYVVRPTGDPNALELWTCQDKHGKSVGFLRKGAELIRPVSSAELAAVPAALAMERTSFLGEDPTGRWAVVEVGDQLTLWKSDTGQRFDLGSGTQVSSVLSNRPDAEMIQFSPDGRYVAYDRPTNHNDPPALVLFDTATSTERILDSRLDVFGEAGLTSLAAFSPDGRQLVFYGNWGTDGLADLAAVDLQTGARVTLAAHTLPQMLQTCVWFTRKDHVVFCNFEDSLNSEAAPLESYEFSTGARLDLGTGRQVVTVPDGSYVAIARSSADIILLEDEDWKPRVVNVGTTQVVHSSACITPSADGRWLSFVDRGGTLRLYDVKNQSVSVLAENAGCSGEFGIGPGKFQAFIYDAGFFLRDGRTFVHLADDANGSLVGVARYDLTSGEDQTTALMERGVTFMAISGSGDFVYGRVPETAWLSSGTTQTQLAWGKGSSLFWFTFDNRYLLSLQDDVRVLDLSLHTTVTHPAQLISLTPRFWVSSSGVVLVSPENDRPVMLYSPSGEELMLSSSRTSVDVSPANTVALYLPTQTLEAPRPSLELVRLEPGATPYPVGRGTALGISAGHAFFRDLDGICAAPLP